ncbi:hypothetical protein CMI37_25210 [Candidatus Pacearchaeota archaeon]|nr:hypothetical protein [Candidatus Pacearchaeota archaeon]
MKKLNIKLILVFILLINMSLVLASPPSLPSTISPINGSSYFSNPTLSCTGSTDPESNEINYSIYYAEGIEHGLTVDRRLYYKLDDGAIWKDERNQYNGSVTGDVVNTTGKLGNGAYFTGVDDFVTLPNNAGFNIDSNFTINLWVKYGSSGSDSRQVFEPESGMYSPRVYEGDAGNDGKLIAYIGQSGGTITTGYTSSTYNDNNFHMVTYIWNTDTNTLNLRIDSTAESLSAVGSPTQISSSLDFGWGGTDDSGSNWLGYMDEIGVWNRALSAQEVADLYNSSYALYYDNFDDTGLNLLSNNQSGSTTFDMESLGLTSAFWNCKSCDNNSECSSFTDLIQVNTINFSECDGGNIAQQFNLLNETASQDLGNYTQDCAYTLTSGYDTKTYTFALAGQTFYSFCLNPLNVSVTLNGFCQYDSTLSGYSYARQYYFDDVILDGGTLRNYSFYQLEDALSTAITFSVTEAGVPLENRIIQIQRYDIATGNYRTVSMLKTDANGQDISYLEQTTAFYKVCIFEVGNPNPVYCSSAFHLTSDSYSIALTTSSALSWSSLVGVAHNLTFDSGSDQFELTYSDPNEKTTQFCLDVFEERFTQRVLVSSNCLSANSGTVQTSVDAINGTTYSAFAFATLFTNTSGQYVADNFLLSQITHSYGMSEAFQNNGLFFIWLLVAIFSLLAFYSPSLALLLAPLPVIFGSFSGIIAIPMGTAFALYLGFIILAVIVGGKE